MPYQVIARKWRPQTFADVVGQQHVTRTLQNAIREGRVAHSYIFSGARGVGKTTTARIVAKGLNCVKGPTAEPCNECDSCREISSCSSLDVLEIDAASNRGIDQVRELREMVRYAPTGGRHRVVILDEAHMLTPEASNALLKTLEEPPEKVVFIMATTEPEDLADTIRSRSQHFHFRALSFGEILEALKEIANKEGLEANEAALGVIARAADGSLRDGMSLLEQARAYCGTTIAEAQVRELLGVVSGEVLDELVAAIDAGSATRVFGVVHRLLTEGQNLQQFCREAVGHFRNLLVAKVCGIDSNLVAAPSEERPRIAEAAAKFSEEDLTRFFQILLSTDIDLRKQPDPRLHLEMGLLRLVNAARLAPLEQVIAELSGNASAPAQRARQKTAAEIATTNNRAAHTPTAATEQATAGAPAAIAETVQAEWRPTTPAPAPSGRNGRANSFSADAAAAGLARDVREEASAGTSAVTSRVKMSAPETAVTPEPDAEPEDVSAPAGQSSTGANGLESAHVDAIKAAVLEQKQNFLRELIEDARRWEIESGEVRLYFPAEQRAMADLLQARERIDKLRTIASSVLGQPVRVCVRLEAVPALNGNVRATQTSGELRARFEQDPVVRAMLERFGGRISEVKRRGEE